MDIQRHQQKRNDCYFKLQKDIIDSVRMGNDSTYLA